ncbi:PROTEIN PHOSPHATASE 2C 26-RELATED [Salix purpurea]|uniref:Protein phosphatase n=1 Tax=Salix purpurea TaxID=77065 RepID=A0A9Q0VUH3_SALPP|nr:PROTEIN PHOSPHATASE 2C 26-RELATED [Salix purpurea]
MAMITVFRASISRSLPYCFPNLLSSSSNRNSAPKKNKLLCYAASSHTKTIRSEMSFCIGTHMIPHPKKVERGGEDSFFVSDYNGGVIAVADGVSGWAERNVDPSLFPQELMANASCLVGDEEVSYDPQILIRKAHAATSAVGSATVIVAMLEANGKLKIANVGDCGLRVIRGDQVFFSTSPQEHYFDCPYQLSSEIAGQTYLDAVVSRVEVMEGDTIVMGSDGLFDNVFDHEIVSTVVGQSDVAEAGIS